MIQGKMAIQTPSGNYRIPGDRMGEFRFNSSRMFNDFFGDMADRIGTYEDCTTLEEMNKARKKFGLPELKK